MMPVIKIENVSKLYKLGFYGADTFRDEVLNFFARLRGKPPVNSVVGATNNLADSVADTDLVWALKDINLTINQGDIVGIIGKNGAGKSTLLKILSKITTPTTGSVKIRGRIASLLEVGTGMHQELTGRENIFLNGAILGMTKHEIRSKLDDIIDFAGIARYIDTPIKRYSSGMRVRLGFAIAAHLEPEILIVDEVLAVGDAEFQKRAIGKMQDISKGEGRTVLFVSHNMTSIKNLCKTGVLMKNEMIDYQGEITQTIDQYLLSNSTKRKTNITERFNNIQPPDAYIKNVFFTNRNNDKINQAMSGFPLHIIVEYYSKLSQRLDINIGIYNSIGEKLIHLSTEYIGENKTKDFQNGKVVFDFEKLPLPEGLYTTNITLWSNNQRYDWIKDSLELDVIKGDYYNSGKIPPNTDNKVFVDYKWHIE